MNSRKKNVFQVAIPLVVLATVFFSCSKYEDGPFLSFRSPFKRVEGTKEVTEFTFDGRDTLSYLTNRFGDFYIDFTTTSNGYNSLDLYIFEKSTNHQIAAGIWGIYDGGKNRNAVLELELADFYRLEFSIKRLTKKEIILERGANYLNGKDTIILNKTALIRMTLKEYTP